MPAKWQNRSFLPPSLKGTPTLTIFRMRVPLEVRESSGEVPARHWRSGVKQMLKNKKVLPPEARGLRARLSSLVRNHKSWGRHSGLRGSTHYQHETLLGKAPWFSSLGTSQSYKSPAGSIEWHGLKHLSGEFLTIPFQKYVKSHCCKMLRILKQGTYLISRNTGLKAEQSHTE